MSAAQTGRKQSPESTAKTRAALLGRKQSPEHVAKLAEIRKGKPIPRATEAAAAKVRGSKQSPEHIAKRTSHRRGMPNFLRKLPDDAVREIRASPNVSLMKLAIRFNVGQTTVFKIRHRILYQDVPDYPNH